MTGPTPPLVAEAKRAATRVGFEHSCRDEVGRLLNVLAAGRQRIAELGTGVGVGAAWLANAAPGRVVTVERDVELAQVARTVLGDAAEVVTGDWTLLSERDRFDLVFADARDAKRTTDAAALLTDGGLLVVDDLTPPALQPAGWRPDDDPVRVNMTTGALAGVELQVAPDHSVIVSRRRAVT